MWKSVGTSKKRIGSPMGLPHWFFKAYITCPQDKAEHHEKPFTWMNYPSCGEASVVWKIGLNPKRDYLIKFLNIHHTPPMMKLNVLGEAPTWMNHPSIYDAEWMLWKRGSYPEWNYLIIFSKCTSHVFHDKVEHRGRNSYMDKPSTMWGRVGASKKRMHP